MDPLDQISLNEQLRAAGVTAVDSKEFYFVSPHPVDDLLQVATARLERPIHLVVSEQGVPGHFCVSGLRTTAVVFSARFVSLSERILRLEDDKFESSRDGLAAGIAFDVMSELCLVKGNLFAAAICFMKARVATGNMLFPDSRSTLGAGTDLWGMDNRAVDEQYITDFFFGLAHEIGHAIEESRGAKGAPWCDDARIAAYVETAARSSQGNGGITYREVGPTETLSLARLRREAAADIEGCRLLAQAALPMVRRHGEPGTELRMERLFAGILVHYGVLAFLNGCHRAVEIATMNPPNVERLAQLYQQPLALAVRQMILQDHLPILAAEMAAPDVDGAAAMFGDRPWDVGSIDASVSEYFKQIWGSVYEVTRPFNEGVGRGLSAAMVFLIDARTDDDFSGLVQRYREMRDDGLIDFALTLFLKAAGSMNLPAGQLDELSALLGA